jgi:hypothetical protein
MVMSIENLLRYIRKDEENLLLQLGHIILKTAFSLQFYNFSSFDIDFFLGHSLKGAAGRGIFNMKGSHDLYLSWS